jgi:hypothetical protein
MTVTVQESSLLLLRLLLAMPQYPLAFARLVTSNSLEQLDTLHSIFHTLHDLARLKLIVAPTLHEFAE